jgi:hypothetical protein
MGQTCNLGRHGPSSGIVSPRAWSLLGCLTLSVGGVAGCGTSDPEHSPTGSTSAGSDGTQAESSAGSNTLSSDSTGSDSDASSATTTVPGGSTSSAGSAATSAGTTGDDSGASTGADKGEQWAEVAITYTGDGMSDSVVLDDCTFCDATIDSGVVLIRFQQAEGWTVWSVYMPASYTAGTHALTPDLTEAYVVINEVNPDLSASFHGFYPGSSNVGTLTLSEADMTPGGLVHGTISAQLSLGDVEAEFEAEFEAILSGL